MNREWLLSFLPVALLTLPPDAAGCDARTAAQAVTEATQLLAAGNKPAAVNCYESALDQSPRDADVVSIRDQLAQLHEDLGQYADARTQLLSLLDIALVTPGDEALARAALLRRLGWIEFRLGEYVTAQTHVVQAEQLYRQHPDAAPYELARTLNVLGAIRRERSDYEQAQSDLDAALALLTSESPRNEDLQAGIHNNLAGLWYYRSDYPRAIEEYRTAFTIFQRLHGDTHADVASALNNLGLMYQELGAPRDAAPFLDRALNVKERLYGPDHVAVASTAANLARVSEQLGNTQRAELLYSRAETIYRRELGPDHPNLSHALHNHGLLRAAQGDSAAAERLMLQALRIRESAYGPDSNWVAETLVGLAPVQAQLGRQPDAEAAALRALSIAVTGGERDLLWNAYAACGAVLESAGDFPAAVFFAKHAVNVIQEMRVEVASLGRPLQVSFLSRRSQVYRDLIDRLITLGRLAEAEQIMTMLREEEYFDYVRTGMRGEDPGLTRAGFSARELPYKERLEQQSRALAEAPRSNRSSGDKATRSPLSSTAQEGASERFAVTVREIIQALRVPVPDSPVATESLDSARDASVARIRYLVTPGRVRIVFAHQGVRRSFDSTIEAAALNRLVFELRQGLQDPQADPLPAARRLYAILLQPLDPALQGTAVRTLDLIPDATLRYVPFGALNDGRHYLVERYSLQLQTLASQPASADDSRGLRIAAMGVSQAVRGLPPLPRVRTELEKIVRRGPADRDGVVPGVMALDRTFTRDEFDRTLGGNYPLLHIASHFVFSPGRLSDSYLVLGDATTYTLQQLRDSAPDLSSVRLLTLSACSTAIGDDAGAGRELESFGTLAQR
ncbi:MAG TPA: tetratricopeptide repeat protein, partial [Povalibacter sp.]|nr:tetratricopeptide repeat protein [Povalibacter sp.]